MIKGTSSTTPASITTTDDILVALSRPPLLNAADDLSRFTDRAQYDTVQGDDIIEPSAIPLDCNDHLTDTTCCSEEQSRLPHEENKSSKEFYYEDKKPLWWKRLSGRRATKGQRACFERMKARGYVITSLPEYGKTIDLESSFIYSTATTTTEARHDKKNKRELIVELGFGDGKNLFTNACRNSERDYLGADIHQPGVGNLLKQIENYENDNSALNNIMVYAGDGVKLIRYLPSASITQILVTFPDPWKNKHQEKFRIIQQEVVKEFERVLLNNGLVLVATDSICFADWTQHVFAATTASSMLNSSSTRRWVTRKPPCREEWLPEVSKYELEGKDASRETILLCWELQNMEL